MSKPDRLTCEEVFARLDDFLDRELSPDEMRIVQAHLDTCGDCAGEYRFEAGVLEGVRQKLRRLDAPSGLLERISALIAEEQAKGDRGG